MVQEVSALAIPKSSLVGFERGMIFRDTNNSLVIARPNFAGLRTLWSPLSNIDLESVSASWQILNALQPCVVSMETDCIESVYAKRDGEMWIEGRFVSERDSVPESLKFNGSVKYGIGPARIGNIYEFNGLTHSKGSLFDITPLESYWINSGSIQMGRMDVSASAVFVDGKHSRSLYEQAFPFSESYYPCLPTYGNPGFQEIAEAECWKIAPDVGFSFRVSIRLARAPTNYATARMENLLVTTDEILGDNLPIRIQIEGRSISIPRLARIFHYDIESERNQWTKISESTPYRNQVTPPWDFLFQDLRPTARWYGAYDSASVSSLAAIASSEFLSQSQNDQIVWRISFNLKTSSNLKFIRRWEVTPGYWRICPTFGITLVSSSNALAFDELEPTWEASDSSLNFNSVSTHLDHNGKQGTGIYEMQMTESYARCVFEVPQVPLTAEISVNDFDGEPKVAIASFSLSQGLLKFRATGYQYSVARVKTRLIPQSPQLSIICYNGKLQETITSAKPVCPTGWSMTKTSATAKKIKISCAKGRMQKKVTGINPVCPKGWKTTK